MPFRRLIPCLDVRAGRVVKGVRLSGLRDAGDPVAGRRPPPTPPPPPPARAPTSS